MIKFLIFDFCDFDIYLIGPFLVYLQVNALSEWIIGIYLHKFTSNGREISIPHEAGECGIENFSFIVSEQLQVNPDNSLAECVNTQPQINQSETQNSYSVWNLNNKIFLFIDLFFQ